MTDSARIEPTADRAPGRTLVRVRAVSRVALAAAYFLVGVAHIRSPHGFVAIVPGWVPYPAQTVFVTGLCELAGSIALLTRRLRWWAGVMLAAYAVCVYPANINHAINGIAIGGTRLGWWYHGPRLAAQPLIVWWALFAGEVTTWPFRGRREATRR
jgi:uncharacterized membrane protein